MAPTPSDTGSAPALPLTGVVNALFRRRAELVAALREERAARALGWRMGAHILVLGGLYGLVIGAYAGGGQVIYDAVKLPGVLLATLALSSALLYALHALTGVRASFAQIVGVVLVGLLATVTLLVALLPVIAFFMFTGERNYYLAVFINVIAFAVAGWGGARVALQCAAAMQEAPDARRQATRVMRWWMLVYGVVGMQMSWLLRPYFRQADVFIRPLSEGGSIFEAIVRLVVSVVGGAF